MAIWPEVASFGGNPDSRHYISWERDVDEYFRRNQMSEDRKIRFAQMHLRGSPEYYWNNVQGRLKYDRHEPIRTWEGMKCKLREKYAPGFDRPQPQPYYEPRRPLYRDPKPNPRRTIYPEPKPNLRELSHSIDRVQESFNKFQALLEELTKKISERTTKGNLEPETPEPIEKFVKRELEPISEPEKEVYEADLILIDEYIEEEELMLDEQSSCGEDSPTMPKASTEKSIEEGHHEEDTLDVAITVPERSLETVEGVIPERYKNFEDLFPSVPYPQEESNPVIPSEDLFPEINDLSFHRVSLPVPAIPFPTQGQFLDFRLMSFIHGTTPEASFSLPLPQPACVSKAIKHQLAEVARIGQVRVSVKFATYFWRTLWHLLGVHVTFSAAHHPSTRGPA